MGYKSVILSQIQHITIQVGVLDTELRLKELFVQFSLKIKRSVSCIKTSFTLYELQRPTIVIVSRRVESAAIASEWLT